MRRNIFVGNLAWVTDDETLQNHFQKIGEVTRAKVMTDMQTGKSRGFAFVTMGTDEQHDEAIRALHNSDLDGRSIVVAEAKEKPRRDDQDRGGNRGDSRDRNGDNRGGGGRGYNSRDDRRY